ncbi:hypothetical protein [Paraburkholderia caribensis]|uniref:hypothetical protein n=1 Tax=Paraburkholderia caribensis TaxID=75105 RepID=UPI002854F790|nr:hypothetical protein [Paraburkholderia caribensis]MDR6381781.1 hypothetical protein [Paraburkholderia caribensis]
MNDIEQLPDDLNPEVVKATAQFIGKITGLVPPPHNAFPPEWYGYLRTFTARLSEIASVNAAPNVPADDAGARKIGIPDVILTGAQLLEALDFIAPDRATDQEQMEATVAIQYGEGHGGKAHYVWCAEYPEEGSFVLDGSSAHASDAAAGETVGDVCQRCGGSGLVPDGEITGTGGVEFENGPVQCVKDCPACAARGQKVADGQRTCDVVQEMPRFESAMRDAFDYTPTRNPFSEVVPHAEDAYQFVRDRDRFMGWCMSVQAMAKSFQARVQPWMQACFGSEISADRVERNHRFFEEATELVQANGMTRSEAHQLVDYTFNRPVGDLHQEVGGVMVTLAALCLASGQDMHAAGETELARINRPDVVIRIRAKQASKPKHSPLPEYVAPRSDSGPKLTNRQIGALHYVIATVKSFPGQALGWQIDEIDSLLRATASEKEQQS